MKYILEKDKIRIESKEDFNPEHILECGQVFSYSKDGDNFIIFPENQFAKIVEEKDGYTIFTSNPLYFEKYFDLRVDYSHIKEKLSVFNILKNPIEFGKGIRILKQNLFEVVISFIVSANNNIKRIKLILSRLREKLGEKTEFGYAFPSLERMREKDESFYKSIGAGYRASYLSKVVWQIDNNTLDEWGNLPTDQLRKKLLTLCGVGPKVADCILLFGYGRGDVFPVDTWIAKMYNIYYQPLDNREKIRTNLVEEFGQLSGYAQQYIFYFQRSG